MDKYRFKQLLESTMGNVKPLIVEEDIKYRSIGQDETSQQKSDFRKKYYNYLLTRINRELNEKYPSSSSLSTTYVEFTKPNVFTMILKDVAPNFVIIFESPKKNIINSIKGILSQYGNLLNLSNDIGGVQNWKEKTDGVKVFNVGYSFLSPTDPNSNIQYPEDKEKKFETFWAWWLDLNYKGIMEIVSKVYSLETENKQQPAVTTPTTTTATPGLSQQPTSTETPQGG
jgi:hypothetical protein